MKELRFRLAAVLVLVLFVATIHVLLSVPRGLQAATPVSPAVSPDTSFPSSLYARAAQALRQNELQTARQHLAEIAAENRGEAATARLIEGLYAYEAGDEKLAEELLAAVSTPGGPLEDWRLFLLAESARENGHDEAAATALDHLLASCPSSPLRPQAYLEAASLAWEAGDERRTLALIEGARNEGLSGEVAVELEHLAWKIGREISDDGVRREAGRRLLSQAPLKAGALGVADTFRAMDGDLDWNRILTSGDVKRRARSFLNVERMTAALDTLDNVPQAERDAEWHLLRAQALTESGQPRQALTALDGVAPGSREEEAMMEWERALALAELADLASPVTVRRATLQTSHRHLARVAKLGGLPPGTEEVSKDTLKELYERFLGAGLFEPAVNALRMLRQVDPGDTTGARDLWERGWREYGRGNYSGAVGYWAELEGVYPEHGDAQRGRYWRARALEQLGQPGRARGIYQDLVAASDTSDFYSRRAMARLGVDTPVSSDIQLARAKQPWPSDPTLQRAKVLTDVGLDELAQREMEIVEKVANPRDLLALRAMVKGRQGERRASIALLREAFPALGGPQQSTVPEEILRAYYPLDYADTILAEAEANGLPPYLVAGIIRQESAFDPRATSPVGARGLMQLMPATASDMLRQLDTRLPSAGLYDPEISIELGSAYFAQLLRGFDGNVELALAGYNGGPNRIRRLWNEAGPTAELDSFVENLYLEESRDYVKRILVLADSYRQLYPSFG